MSQSLRQSELFTGNDWQVLYRAFTDINFNASDPPSINRALRTYIQQNYPENFNDWIESSEFVALIDLLSWLAGTLAFKTDLNARESFLETAQQRASILRLARFISYNPSRNQCAQGLAKIVEVSTDDDVYDGYGTNLNGQTIIWDNPDDPDWFERFIIVLNNSFIGTNPFGVPLKTGTVSLTKTQLFRFNNVKSDASWSFTSKIGGTNMPFEVIDPDFDDGGGIYERDPDYNAATHILYRNDANGNSSDNTGFFVMFKQGSLQNTVFNIPYPIEDNILSVPATNVNDTDVWVQTVTDNGTILNIWEKVPAIFSENITYNNYSSSVRNIFSVVTGINDTVSIRFSDGRFGNVPTGNIRVWYRTSNGLQYQIRPSDMSRVSIKVPYYNKAGVKRNLTVTFSLQQAISNSAPAETNAQIQARAPSVYATQNRMVSGEDYNTFPLQSTLALKIKALNRVYSGHSRFIDLNDPTGNYQDINVFSDDGIFFKENYSIYTEVPTSFNSAPSDIVSLYLQTVINRQEVQNFANDYILNNPAIVPSPTISWNRATSDSSFVTTGYFSSNNSQLMAGATIQFLYSGIKQWATIVSISGDATVKPAAGSAGPVVLSLAIPDGATILRVLPAFQTGLDPNTSSTLSTNITNPRQSDLWYDYIAGTWSVNPASPTSNMFLVASMYYNTGSWSIEAKGIRYVFESLKNVQWYNDGRKTTDEKTGTVQADIVRILKVNPDYNNGGLALGINYDLNVDRIYLNRDGSANPRRTTVILSDENYNGYADAPDTFQRVIANPPQFLFWQHDDTYGDIPMYGTYQYPDNATLTSAALPSGTVAFEIDNGTFWVSTATGTTPSWSGPQRIGTYSVGVGRGPNIAVNSPPNAPSDPISFQWKHYASTDQRIDPARTNINDIFVLTSEYDYLVRLWISTGADPNNIPTPPTELDLRLAFQSFEDYRMFSDQIVWRPVKYKYLFGNGSSDQLKGKFKVVKLSNSTLSDGEIASEVIRAINTYFDSTYWDFGETFYYTELAAYIHTQLANIISSIVFVPTYAESNFGDGFEVRCRSDEIFISTAQVSDVDIITSNTASNLRIR